jgi:uncharacterized protein DUF4129
MRRRVVMVATVTAVLVVLAASSGRVRVWTSPPAQVGPSPAGTIGNPQTTAPPDTVVDEPGGAPAWNSALLQVVGVLVLLAAVVALVSMRGSVRRPRWRRRFAAVRRGEIVPLPEPAHHELVVDVDAARAALASGEPRNAIVACWMQLERDAAAAGLARSDAETSAEYTQRVVASSSVDATPITELAALYREARFSRHDLDDVHRSRAVVALDRVATALQRGVKAAT